ncbi:MAG: hypothetical protein V1803_02345 [Candidatus Roizmanbacteria bacterium]
MIIFLIIFSQINDRRTKIVFCDVGQGDAAYIRIKNRVDVLIDAGPDRKILNCLGRHMPFWDRKIELGILSHPNKDHYGGFSFILDRYQLDNFLTVKSVITSKTYKGLVNKIVAKEIPFQFKIAGDKIKIENDEFIFFWPPVDFKSYQDNDYSLVFLFKENGFKALFTGDSSQMVLDRIASSSTSSLPRNDIPNIDILKIPHHGSAQGLTKKFLELADPKVAVINVGKNNQYGHPVKAVLDMLKAKNIKIKRTDKDGDIVFKLKELF